jgi:hypothetical protein
MTRQGMEPNVTVGGDLSEMRWRRVAVDGRGLR